MASACLGPVPGRWRWTASTTGMAASWATGAVPAVLLPRVARRGHRARGPDPPRALPRSIAEIRDPRQRITFNASLMKELRAVRFVQKLLHDGWITIRPPCQTARHADATRSAPTPCWPTCRPRANCAPTGASCATCATAAAPPPDWLEPATSTTPWGGDRPVDLAPSSWSGPAPAPQRAPRLPNSRKAEPVSLPSAPRPRRSRPASPRAGTASPWPRPGCS